MPRIEDYSAQTEAQGPVGGLDPRVEAAGYMGRQVEKLGGVIGQTGQEIFKRQEQAEISDTYATFADARSKWTSDLQDQVQKGTLNVDEFKQKYQDFVDSQADKVTTASGKNFFNRQAARLGGSLLTMAAHGQVAIAGAKAVADYQSGQNSLQDALMKDPSQFQDAIDSTHENIDGLTAAGSVPADKAPMFIGRASTDLAKAAVRGWAQIDPVTAKKKLDDGEFDKYFDGDAKKQMYGEVQMAEHGKAIEDARIQKAQDDAQATKADQTMQDWLPKILSNSLSTKDVTNNHDLDFGQKARILNMIEQNQNKEIKTDPRVVVSLARRALLPDGDPQKITDMSQLSPYVGKGLNLSDVTKINNFIAKTPEGIAINADRKKLLDYAGAALIKKDAMGIQDPQGQKNVAQFMTDLQNQEAQMRTQGLPLKSLYDPSSKDYFGNKIDGYKRSSQEIMQDQAQQYKDAANKQINPTTGQQLAKPPPDKIQPGESPADFLARIRSKRPGQ